MSRTRDVPRAELRPGVVGLGRIAQAAHLPAACKADRVRLVAVCDESPALVQPLAQRYGVPGFTELAHLLEEEIDAVLIATPDRSHLSVAAEAMTAGKHVLVEKPLADTVAAAAELGRGHLRVRSFFPSFRRASEVTVFT